jgi:uncharacterized protein (DUF608 family)
VARITKKDLLLNRPEALKEFEAEGKRFYVLKEEWFENLKKILAERLFETAFERRYYIYSEIVYRETADALYACVMAYPRFAGILRKLLKLPNITPEEFKQRAIEKINEYEFKPIYVEEFKELKNGKQT